MVSDAGRELCMMSVRTALGAMWHQCKQLVGAVSCRQNNSLVDWVFTFHSAQVGMRLVWCLPSRWEGGGPAWVAVCVLATDPFSHCLLVVWLAWRRGWRQQKGAKFGKLITGMGTEYVSPLIKTQMFLKFTLLSRLEFARTLTFTPACACVWPTRLQQRLSGIWG